MTPQAELRRHFEGVSAEPDDVLNVFMREFSATVRMRNEEAAERARRALHGTLFRHLPLYVYRFRGIKIYVGNLPKGCGTEDIRPLFEDFGPVVACDVVKSGVKGVKSPLPLRRAWANLGLPSRWMEPRTNIGRNTSGSPV
uniref:RRM domain-containing protein n=1 Tax=Anolis carolinensis TaxID=28377 RepID=H9GU83_ANOCA